MKKKMVCIAISAMVGALLIGCNSNNEQPSTAVDNITVDDVKIALTSTDSGVKLSWQRVKGVSFSVYKSLSRYGEYVPVDDNISNGKYTDNAHYCYYRVVAHNRNGETLKIFPDIGEETEMFGNNVYVFSPDDDVAKVKNDFSDIKARMEHAEFDSFRYSFLLKQGEYANDIGIDVGYYTTVAGLGSNPTDTSIRSLSSKNRDTGGGTNINALVNFWRGAENIQVRSNMTWATSQGAYLRAVDIQGDLSLSDGSGYASGGLLADARVSGQVKSGTQQQWLSRNCEWSSWSGNLWNMCFSGVKNPPAGDYPRMKYTVEETSTIREKPFLTFDEIKGYRIAIPAYRQNAIGCSWTGSEGRIEKYIEQDDIYFARADRDSADTVNAAISSGKSVVFAPGVYTFDKTIKVDNNDTVLLGLGIATITPTNGNACLTVTASGVTIAGLLFDAGEKKSDALVYIGTENSTASKANLHDCFFRVGGNYQSAAADTSLVIHADNTTCDNIWMWRADHGNGVGWNVNDGITGAKIYGNNVTAYALMAEHYKGHNVEWYGENGKLFFYQSEIAYDVLNQSDWMDGLRRGYSSLMVDDSVNSFTASGLGVYSNFHNSGIVLDSAITAPAKQGINISHIVTVRLNGNGAIMNAVNDYGGAAGGNQGGLVAHYTKQFEID